MKTRTGFVSNSSSSSFLLQFNCVLTSPEQLKPLLGYLDTKEAESTEDAIVNFVFGELGEPLSKSEILKLMEEEFDQYCIPNKKDSKLYEAASKFRWEGHKTILKPVYEKYGIKTAKDSHKLIDSKRDMFVLEYSEAQIEYSLLQRDKEKIMAELHRKYIPPELDKF
jgi:Fe-S cluster biosynthesis and repair protein YggX